MYDYRKVLIYKSNVFCYPNKDFSFSPSTDYPEYQFKEIAAEENAIYALIRESFRFLGYDKDNFGAENWNPLGEYIKPGDTVLIKPNLVLEKNQKPENGTDCLITHASIIRAVADYALIALKGTGKLIIGDAPLQSCDFEALCSEQGLNKILGFYSEHGVKTDVELCDFRNFKSKQVGAVLVEQPTDNSAQGITVDLAENSAFSGIPKQRYKNLRVTNYPHRIMRKHHKPGKNEYIVAKKALEADVIISMPKPKTHRFAGVTISMKNFVGIVANKECLPHHSIGSFEDFGDEYEKRSLAKKTYARIVDLRNIYMRKGRIKTTQFLRVVEGKFAKLFGVRIAALVGSWHGNDTIWRTIIDLNKIIKFADKDGVLCDNPQRKILIIGDMIISGHETGPLSPTPLDVGVMAIGDDVVCFDEAVCAYMGFDYSKIPTIRNARDILGKYVFSSPAKTRIVSNHLELNEKLPSELTTDISARFIPNPAWKDFLS